MSPPPHRVHAVPVRPATRRPGVEGLLRDLPGLQRASQAGVRAGEDGRRLATGIDRLDALLGGGFPSGRLSEIAGPASSGRTSLARALLSRATQRGEWVAWVDAAGAFDADSAASAGAVLEHVLWVRPPAVREAARCCECLLEAGGFALVVLDLAVADAPARSARPPLPPSAWQRLARRSAGSGCALLVLSPARATGSFCDLALEMQPGRARFSAAPQAGAPRLLEGLSIEARVTRHRTGPAQQIAGVVLPVAGHAA